MSLAPTKNANQDAAESGHAHPTTWMLTTKKRSFKLAPEIADRKTPR